jgi:hypothetical protein
MHFHQLSSPFLKNFLLKKFGLVSLQESRATCDDCLCSKSTRGNLPYYQKDLKCCTFHPFLPNYAVGAILDNPLTPDFIKKQIHSKINLKHYALPLGIFAPLNYQIQFNNRHENDFGNKKEFLCPYFDLQNKNCGIWQHRGSVCTSYFCISDRGDKGLKIWELIGEYLHLCEMVLSQDALVSMGLPPDIIENQLEYVNCISGTEEEMVSSSMNQVLFQEYWKEWVSLNSISQYYIDCSKYISGLSHEQLDSLLIEDTQQLEYEIKILIKTRVRQ